MVFAAVLGVQLLALVGLFQLVSLLLSLLALLLGVWLLYQLLAVLFFWDAAHPGLLLQVFVAKAPGEPLAVEAWYS
jgi:hypothetical protein